MEPALEDIRDPGSGERFGIARCPRCGLGHTVPRPTNPGNYPYAPGYYGNRHGFTLRYCLSRRLRFLRAACDPSRGRLLLDVGCGDGSFLLAARQAGWEVVGTELNPAPARAAGLEVERSLDRFSGRRHTLSCVTLWHSLEHLPDPIGVLRQIRAQIGPAGRVVIAVPDWGGLQAKACGRGWPHLDVPRHLYHFTADALVRCLAAAGFRVERRWHQEFEYDLLGWVQGLLNRLMKTPNVFFDLLAGKGGRLSAGTKVSTLVLGSLLAGLCLPALAVGTLLRKGGTLVVVASPDSLGAEDR